VNMPQINKSSTLACKPSRHCRAAHETQ
jgi:hypothetical protein